MAAADLTLDVLRSQVHYDPETGVFTRLKDATGGWKAGTKTGAAEKNTGYVRIRIADRYYKAHRVAWLYVYGQWPSGMIDHINGIRDDNRIANLRDVSVAVNNENVRDARAGNLCGHLGVTTTKIGRFATTIRTVLAGVRLQLYLGTYDTAEQAHAVYVDAKRRLHDGYVDQRFKAL